MIDALCDVLSECVEFVQSLCSEVAETISSSKIIFRTSYLNFISCLHNHGRGEQILLNGIGEIWELLRNVIETQQCRCKWKL